MRKLLFIVGAIAIAGCASQPKGGQAYRTLSDMNNRPVVGMDLQSGDLFYYGAKDDAVRTAIMEIVRINSQFDLVPKPPPAPPTPAAAPDKKQEKKK